MSYAPTLVTGGTSALGKVLFLDCQLEWNVPEEIPKACAPFLLPSLPHLLDTSHFLPLPATPLCGGCFHHRWADPKEGSWRWEPYHPETRSPGDFPKLFQPRGSTSFGCSRCSFIAGGPPGSGGCGPMQRGAGMPGPWGQGSLAGISSPGPSAP